MAGGSRKWGTRVWQAIGCSRALRVGTSWQTCDERVFTTAMITMTTATKTTRDTARLLTQPLLLMALVCAAPFLQFYLGNMHEGLPAS